MRGHDPLQRAEQAYAAGRLDEARQWLGAVAQPTGRTCHLLALVEKRRGDADAARAAFAAALALDPGSAQAATDFGIFLSSIGDDEGACRAFQQALETAGDLAPALRGYALSLGKLGRIKQARAAFGRLAARHGHESRTWNALGAFERDQGELDAAARAFERARELAPGNAAALHGRARIALERAEADAAERYRAALAAVPGDPMVRLGAAQAAAGRDPERAMQDLRALTRDHPDWPEPYAVLARLRWARGDGAAFTEELDAAVAARPGNAALWSALIAALNGVDRRAEAADAAARARAATGEAGFILVEAASASEGGDLDRAERLFAGLAAMKEAWVPEARHRLKRGEIGAAERLLELARQGDGDDMLAWALTATLWRLTGDQRADWLCRPELIGTEQLDCPPEQLARIARKVAALHEDRMFPVGQSLRGGTQTLGRLLSRCEEEIVELRRLIEAAVLRFWEGLPAPDGTHPLLRHRAGPARLAGSWSVRLTGGGFHVAHVHPRGLLSTACYLRLAGDWADGEGLLEIGRPPADMNIDLPPLRTIAPRPGLLALFPSYMFHGTRRFGAGERLTVAFDLVA